MKWPGKKWPGKTWLGTLALVALLGCAGSACAAGKSEPAPTARLTTKDLHSLQRGARLFVNYCLGCHSAAFMRYSHLTGLGLSEQEIKNNLMFTSDRLGDTMEAAIKPEEAKKWFGAMPPDLSVVTRSRTGYGSTGAEYIYTFLRSFYRDDSRPTGWNNQVFPNTAMPHPLWEMQGERVRVMEKVKQHGVEVEVFKGWKQVSPGSSADFDRDAADLVNYLTWMAEPVQNQRVRMGVCVVLFLLLLSIALWRLDKAYWKDLE